MNVNIAGSLLAVLLTCSACSGSVQGSTAQAHDVASPKAPDVGTKASAQAEPAPAPKPTAEFDPLTNPTPLLRTDKPVKVLNDWARTLTQREAPAVDTRPSEDTPGKLLARLAEAERKGDYDAFAKCLQLTSDDQLPWAAALLLVQARIRVNDALIAASLERFGESGDVTRIARGMRATLPQAMSQAEASELPTPGLYLPNGRLMFRIRPTPAGWFIVPGGYDEAYEQPRKNAPMLLRDYVFIVRMLERVRDKAELPDAKTFVKELTEDGERVMRRAKRELDREPR